MPSAVSYTKAGADSTFAPKNLSNPEARATIVSMLGEDVTVVAAAQEAVATAVDTDSLTRMMGPSQATYRHPRGANELIGTAIEKRSSGWSGYGLKLQMAGDTYFNQIQLYAASLAGANVVAKIYIQNENAAHITEVPDAVYSFAEGEIPRFNSVAEMIPGLITIKLPVVLNVPPGYYISVFLTSTTVNAIAVKYFSGADNNPAGDRLPIYIVSTPTGSAPATNTYMGTAFNLDIRTTVGDALTLAQEADSNLDAFIAAQKPRVLLPPKLYALIGEKFQIFRQSVYEHPNPASLVTQFECTKGASFPRYYEITPTVTENLALTARIENLDSSSATSAATTLAIKPAPANPATMKRIMTIGDSLTAANVWVPELRRRLMGSGGLPAGLGFTNIKFVGNVPLSGAPTQAQFGYGGWTLANWMGITNLPAYWFAVSGHGKTVADQKAVYRDSNGKDWTIETIEADRIKAYATNAAVGAPPASGTLTHVAGGTNTASIVYTAIESAPSTPFWDPIVNFFSIKYWVDTYGDGVAPDIIPLQLGWNGMPAGNTGTSADHSVTKGQLQLFLDRVKAEYPAAKVVLLGLQMPSPTGGTGTNYGATGTYGDAWKLRRKAAGYNLMLQEVAAQTAYSAMTYYCDVASQFDSEYNMPWDNQPVNSRSATTERRGNNGVHPSTDGYYQMADAVYRLICHIL